MNTTGRKPGSENRKTGKLRSIIKFIVKTQPGATNAEIARQIGLPVATVAPHARDARKLLGVYVERGPRRTGDTSRVVALLRQALELLDPSKKDDE